MSLQILESLHGVDLLCQQKLFSVNRELWPDFMRDRPNQMCFSPVNGGGCCRNCFDLNWPGMSFTSSNSDVIHQLTPFVAARSGIPIPSAINLGPVNPAACQYAYNTGCTGPPIVFLEYFNSGPLVSKSLLSVGMYLQGLSGTRGLGTAQYAFENNRTSDDNFSPWRCSGGTFHLAQGQSATHTDLLTGTTITWPTSVEIVAAPACTNQHQACGLFNNTWNSSSWGWYS